MRRACTCRSTQSNRGILHSQGRYRKQHRTPTLTGVRYRLSFERECGAASSLSFFHALAQLSLAADPSRNHQRFRYYTSRAGIAFTILNGSAMTVHWLPLFESHNTQASRVVHLRVNVARSDMVSRLTKIGAWNPSSQLPALRAWITHFCDAMVEVDRPACLETMRHALRR